MIRIGVYNLLTQEAADDYLAHVGTDGTPEQRAERAADWRTRNTALWRGEGHPAAWKDDIVENIPDPRAAEKAAWGYHTTYQAKSVAVVVVDARPASEGYDHFDFDKQHPALRR